MASLNQCTFIGNLGRDPEIRYSKDGKAVASFSIACSESWKDKQTGEKKELTEWVNISAFGNLAEIIEKYLKKGSQVYISGKYKTDKYEKDGQTHYSTKIIAKDLVMLGGKAQANNEASEASQDEHNQSKSDGYIPQSNDFDDDLPF